MNTLSTNVFIIQKNAFLYQVQVLFIFLKISLKYKEKAPTTLLMCLK